MKALTYCILLLEVDDEKEFGEEYGFDGFELKGGISYNF